MTAERIALFMCAAHCQGGHSAAGMAAADALGITFPITMKKLANRARKDGLDPKKLWPWWEKASPLSRTALSASAEQDTLPPDPVERGQALTARQRGHGDV